MTSIKDKRKNKDWTIGDTFAIKIDNINKKYDGQYVILIKRQIDSIAQFFKTNNLHLFAAKITTNYRLPTNKEELEKLEYIKTLHFVWEDRFYPYDRIERFAELRARKNAIEYYPDEYGYLFSYYFILSVKKNAKLDELEYLGNFQLDFPKDEIIAGAFPMIILDKKGPDKLLHELLELFDCYNKRLGHLYTNQGLERAEQKNEETLVSFFAADIVAKKYKENGKMPDSKESKEIIKNVQNIASNYKRIKEAIYYELGLKDTNLKRKINFNMLNREEDYIVQYSKDGTFPDVKTIYKDIKEIKETTLKDT